MTDDRPLSENEPLNGSTSAADYELVPYVDETAGRGFVVRSVATGDYLPWRELPRAEGLEAFAVAGVSHRPQELQSPSFAPGSLLRLIPEPENPHDPHAVGVWNSDRTVQAGYVPRERARDVRRRLEANEALTCIVMWEVLEAERRVALRALIIGEAAAVRLATPR